MQWKVSNCLVFVAVTINTSTLCVNLAARAAKVKTGSRAVQCAQYGGKRWSLHRLVVVLQQHSRADRVFASPLHLTLLLHLMLITKSFWLNIIVGTKAHCVLAARLFGTPGWLNIVIVGVLCAIYVSTSHSMTQETRTYHHSWGSFGLYGLAKDISS